MRILLLSLILSVPCSFVAQDTFSIVALDPETGEVGSAGASCVDMFQTTINTDHFIGELFPGLGAINTQAWYIPANQDNAADRMIAGDSPQEIIDWLTDNDVQNTPEFRQYGIVGYDDGALVSAGFTGSSTDNYKNHIAGPNYCIQGNILLGQEVLDSMESRFIAEQGDLACKLMAALQGANMVGADSRCFDNGTSSLFAFVQVAQPSDANLNPSFVESVRTHDGDGIEPIDSLQVKFDLVHTCGPTSLMDYEGVESSLKVFPNPAMDQLNVSMDLKPRILYRLEIQSLDGRVILSEDFAGQSKLNISSFAPGLYHLIITGGESKYSSSFIKE